MSTSLGSPTLVLVPTELEARRLVDAGGFGSGSGLLRVCGFGPVAAAATTVRWLTVLRPARVLLVGICGTFDPERAPLGTARTFGAVAQDGIGVGEGAEFLAPPALGFPQLPATDAGVPSAPIFDELRLDEGAAGATESLLSTCAASGSPAEAARRRERHPSALAEDMEGFAVALACALCDTPLAIVRGVSNVVGERDPSTWRIPLALESARRAARELLAGTSPWHVPRTSAPARPVGGRSA